MELGTLDPQPEKSQKPVRPRQALNWLWLQHSNGDKLNYAL